MTTEKEYRVKRGDDFILYFEFVDDAGEAVDITDWTLFVTVKEREEDDDEDAVASAEQASHTSPTGGTTKLKIPAADMDALEGAFHYDVQVKNDADEIFTLLSGTMYVGADKTRRTS